MTTISISLLLILKIQSNALCDQVLPFDNKCRNEVLECTYDEGNSRWCFEEYIGRKYQIKID